MNDTVIKVENLSKLYYLGELHHRNNSFRETVTETVKRLMPSAKRKTNAPMGSAPNSIQSSQEDDHIWALKDVSFEIKRGEILGIIGRNGAGKSTLLKILSRITKPTKGNAWINGRVASLLEVGTGFHPELTGRENIYLNSAILGMKKWEIKKKFDEIVAFAEIEKFIDTPVKRYSSGMYVRLAFAVAAHLEPEILLVDEVLAVGDIEFQKKCIGKMGAVANEGRTVLFVSHNISAIQRLCPQTILLNNGNIIINGETPKVIEVYLSSAVKKIDSFVDLTQNNMGKSGSDSFRFTKCWIINSRGKKTSTLKYGEPFSIGLEIESPRSYRNLAIQVGINSFDGVRIFTSDSEEFGFLFSVTESSKVAVTVSYEDFSLMPGQYQISKLMIRNGQHELATLLDVGSFEVLPRSFEDKSPQFVKTGQIVGKSLWEIH